MILIKMLTKPQSPNCLPLFNRSDVINAPTNFSGSSNQ